MFETPLDITAPSASTTGVNPVATVSVEHPASRYRVGMRFEHDGQTWAVTALDFVFNKAILRPCDGMEGSVNLSGERREILLAKIPLKGPSDA